MVTATTFRTPYENRRLKVVRETLTTYSTLDGDASGELAVHVLRALNSIPESVR